MHYVAHDWKTRVKRLSDHPAYRDHTRDAAKTWSKMTSIEQAKWAPTEACRETIRVKSLSDEDKRVLDCKRCEERCSELRQKSVDLSRRADRLAHRAENGKRPLNAYMTFAQEHRNEYSGSPVAQARALGERWRSMSDEEKSSYISEAYENWRSEHIGSGLSAKLKRKK